MCVHIFTNDFYTKSNFFYDNESIISSTSSVVMAIFVCTESKQILMKINLWTLYNQQ